MIVATHATSTYKGETRMPQGLDWIDAIRQGLPLQQLQALTTPLQMSQTELVDVLHIPRRTLSRRQSEGVLSREESEKVLRMARALARAVEVFDHEENAVRWLKTPNPALAGATPLSLMDTGIGAETVMDTLGRIEYGVFA